MIIENYSTFRSLANPGGSIGVDGLVEFDASKMRSGGFDGGITANPIDAFPIEATCNAYANDASPGVDEYDWYVSQRTSVAANKPFVLTRLDSLGQTRSGSIAIDISAWADAENSDPFDISTVRVLFFAVDLYVIRRSDGAIQRLDLQKYLLDALAPKTGIE